jgi:hypothetical protein
MKIRCCRGIIIDSSNNQPIAFATTFKIEGQSNLENKKKMVASFLKFYGKHLLYLNVDIIRNTSKLRSMLTLTSSKFNCNFIRRKNIKRSYSSTENLVKQEADVTTMFNQTQRVISNSMIVRKYRGNS